MEIAKRAAGYAAAELIQSDMTVGLGTGTTAFFFIEALAMRVQKGLILRAAVASSKESFLLAKERGLPMRELNDILAIDVTVDGADEIDPKKRMIKGGGGAHVREKILASSSHELIVIVDETKCVSSLGKAKLPVEILFFGFHATRKKLEALGYMGEWRTNAAGDPFITENGNLLFDIAFASPLLHPEKEEERILPVPGVIDTGFFFHLGGRVIIGHRNGTVTINT